MITPGKRPGCSSSQHEDEEHNGSFQAFCGDGRACFASRWTASPQNRARPRHAGLFVAQREDRGAEALTGPVVEPALWPWPGVTGARLFGSKSSRYA